ncbi:tRNA lysidine(34) synthetase TilS [Extibacter muris]|uniref:tRNA lysidine(34) synthetase TilS n=1 Tax=Extibacter muris TaxID=1796622 RepID=UPI001D083940|nr:tRNA lysidine(34) synthetase TilS [Extibacter muris]MCB6203753.1 tRNA lysidine(34) synthetase TilS [Extibacter muris]MCQ4665495.1 tRNA lysidine(34) synthetase TilS [Extibacter muris]MCQ4694874.1 tRNA lysidine(34) synthetase TilS [Extibacter muris]
MYQRVREYAAEHHMLQQSDIVIAGISGGADSICLLFVLLRLKKEIGFSVTAVHVHHGLRADSADRDAGYVEKICREQGIELVTFHEDVRAYARQHKLTEEEAGREVRRAAFMEVLKQKGGTKIALAHHQNDNVETLLLNLCRGTGLKGIGGIPPAEGVWIHPLLCLKRKEVESYLEERGISYCTDETNLEDGYARNKIRNHVVPYLEAEINVQSSDHMAETMRQMRLLGEYVETETRRYKKACICTDESGFILLQKEAYVHVPEALRPYVVHSILCQSAGKSKDIEAVHVRLVRELMDKQVGRRISLPYGVTAERSYEGIRFAKEGQSSGGKEETADMHMTSRVIERTPQMRTFPKSPYTKWFDYDIIKNTVKMRHREPGDYLTIDREGRTQKLKQYFINEKIPREKRDRIWLVADGHHIMWVVGGRQNQSYQVTEHTKRILVIEVDGGEKDGRDC